MDRTNAQLPTGWQVSLQGYHPGVPSRHTRNPNPPDGIPVKVTNHLGR
jgi:hypothetical protein